MGNCNSENQLHQMCKACNGGWTWVDGNSGGCDCTAGLDKVCGGCNPVWKTNIPGTYDAQFNAWVKANPKPAPLVAPQPPQIGAASFACVECTQCQDFSGLTAQNVGSINISDISQMQTCVGNMQSALDKQNTAAAIAAAQANTQAQMTAQQAKLDAMAATLAAQQAAALAKQKATSDAILAAQQAQIIALQKQQAYAAAQAKADAEVQAQQAAFDASEQQKMMLVVFLFVIFVVICYIAVNTSGVFGGHLGKIEHGVYRIPRWTSAPQKDY